MSNPLNALLPRADSLSSPYVSTPDSCRFGFETREQQQLYQDPLVIQRLLRKARTIAVVGLSTDTQRASWIVANYLQQAGYRIIPVNPKATEILGQKVYPDLASIPEPVDLVNVFRRPAECLAVAEQAVAIHAPALWLQLGVINLDAAERARLAGLTVVMDRCIEIEHARYFGATAP